MYLKRDEHFEAAACRNNDRAAGVNSVRNGERNWDAFALLLIDVQRDFWTDNMSQELPAYENNVGRLLALSRSEGIDIVHVRARFLEDKSDWMVKYKLQQRIPCIAGTAGVEVFPFAEAKPGEFLIYKQSFDGFQKPALAAYLKKNDKQFLLVAGLVTSVCVFLTAASAAQRGYLVAAVDDCCADQSAAHDQTLKRYPFIFDRTTVDQINANHGKWLADLAKLAT